MLHRHPIAQAQSDFVECGQFASLAIFPLRGPTLELSLDVSLAASEVAQTNGVDVYGMQIGEHVHEVLAGVHS